MGVTVISTVNQRFVLENPKHQVVVLLLLLQTSSIPSGQVGLGLRGGTFQVPIWTRSLHSKLRQPEEFSPPSAFWWLLPAAVEGLRKD